MITVVTKFPIAFDSPDHLVPLGTKRDNHRNILFVKSCEKLLHKMGCKSGNILDLGCAGGGCVEDFAKRGHNAIGLEGSDYSLICKRDSWATIPDRLFTCDISRPYKILDDDRLMKYDIIYSFEVMEHIHPKRLKVYFENIYNHMKGTSIFIGSFTTTKSRKFPDHHQTIMNKKQWHSFVKKLNLFKILNLKWKSKQYLRTSALKENCLPIVFKKK